MRAVRISELRTGHAPRPKRSLDTGQPLPELVTPGRIVELCGEGRTTAAAMILAHAQREAETAVWIQPEHGDLYPPDLAEAGIDIEALIVVHVPQRASNSRRASRRGRDRDRSLSAEQCRSAEMLLRSGAFGLVILDFTRGDPVGSTAWQGRLLGLARQHEARLLILRDDRALEGPSLGPLVSLRIASHFEPFHPRDLPPEARRDPAGFKPRTNRYWLVHEVLKNKSGGPLQPRPVLVRGPWGLG